MVLAQVGDVGKEAVVAWPGIRVSWSRRSPTAGSSSPRRTRSPTAMSDNWATCQPVVVAAMPRSAHASTSSLPIELGHRRGDAPELVRLGQVLVQQRDERDYVTVDDREPSPGPLDGERVVVRAYPPFHVDSVRSDAGLAESTSPRTVPTGNRPG